MPFMQLEKAAANLLFVCQQAPYDDAAFQYFGLVMAKRDRMRIAHASLIEALRLNPRNLAVKKALEQFPEISGGRNASQETHEILLDVYPSQAPRRLVQMLHDSSGRSVPDGIEVEFHENGQVKRFLDIDQGIPNGLEIPWDRDGRELTRQVYRLGKPVHDTP